MTITQRSLETLIDLVEIKLSCLEVYDKDDARELAKLELCLNELNTLAGRETNQPQGVVSLAGRGRSRARALVAVRRFLRHVGAAGAPEQPAGSRSAAGQRRAVRAMTMTRRAQGHEVLGAIAAALQWSGCPCPEHAEVCELACDAKGLG